MAVFNKTQPKDGETILMCAHQTAKRYHFWKSPSPCFAVTDKQGILTKVHWLIACDDCKRKSGNNPDKIAWMTLDKWDGDDPIIEIPFDD